MSRRFATSAVIRTTVAAAVMVAMCVIVTGPGATPATALETTDVMGIVAVTDGPDAEHPVLAYSLLTADGNETCELITIDWMTGLVTDLPSIASAEACVTDLAVAPDGTVYGIRPNELFGAGEVSCVSDPCTTPLARLVTFADDGTPTSIDIFPSLEYPFRTEYLGLFRGIAVDDDGVIHVIVNQMWVDVTDCSPAPVELSLLTEDVADETYDWSACLFSVDPTSGAMTLVGPSRMSGDVLAGFSIGSEGAWTLMFAVSPLDVEPVTAPEAYWSLIDPASGEVTPIGPTYSTDNGQFDQLRSGTTVYALVADPVTEQYVTAIVDPLTGAITPIAALVTELPPTPEPLGPVFTG